MAKKPTTQKGGSKKDPKGTHPGEKIEPAVVTTEVVKIIEKGVAEAPVKYLSYGREQLEQIKDVYAKGASDVEFANFIIVSVRTGLDIFKKQIYLVPRWDSSLGKNVYSAQTGIDGFRSIAERTEAYAGNDDPVFEGIVEGTKYPEKATATVYKVVQGQRYPFTASARWSEYYPGDKVGFMWKQKPHVMLGKCAESLALRKAFPNNLGGIYTTEEMAIQQAELKPLGEKKVNEMFEKAKLLFAKKTDVEIIRQDMLKIQESEKYSEEQKEELGKIALERIFDLDKKNKNDDGKGE